MDPIEVGAMEKIVVIVQFDFRSKNVAPDWSVTAWAPELYSLSIEHSKGYMTDRLPYIRRVEPEKKQKK